VKQVDEGFNGKEVDLAIGETLEVRLKENRTTGHKWSLDASTGSTITLIKDAYEAGTAVGQAGTHTWDFRADESGPSEIKLSYRRPWEENQTPAQIFVLHVRVT
jgi:inhibitor of cysteine peptidase